jgi:hypothetical protein
MYRYRYVSTYIHLDIFLVFGATAVVIIQQVVFAEELKNGIERIRINRILTVFKAIFS